MSNLLIITGPPAAGKAAIGTEVARLTGYRLFHNHLTSEPAAALFGWGTDEQMALAESYRLTAFQRVLDDPRPIGVVFTFVWGFDLVPDNRFIHQVVRDYTARGRKVFFLELRASLEARIAREGTALRVSLKPSKQNVELARALHTAEALQIRMNSNGDFPYPEKHLVIDTEQHLPQAAARLAIERFGLPEIV